MLYSTGGLGGRSSYASSAALNNLERAGVRIGALGQKTRTAAREPQRADIDACMVERPSFVPMYRLQREGWNTDRDVLRSFVWGGIVDQLPDRAQVIAAWPARTSIASFSCSTPCLSWSMTVQSSNLGRRSVPGPDVIVGMLANGGTSHGKEIPDHFDGPPVA